MESEFDSFCSKVFQFSILSQTYSSTKAPPEYYDTMYIEILSIK